MPPFRHILYCHCAFGTAIDDTTRRAALARVLASGVPFTAVDDLCGKVARGDTALASLDGPLLVVACRPRAVRALLATAGVMTDEVTVADLRADGVTELDRLLAPAPADDPDLDARVGAFMADLAPDDGDAWVPWYPVIDRERCTDCGACLNFCIFGVFDRDEAGRPEVAMPAACKTNCPACARVCPAGALIFPKHPHGPVDGSEGDAEPAQVDLERLMQGDVDALLRARSGGGRFSQAAGTDELCPCVTGDYPPELLAELGVPPSVLEEGGDALRAVLVAHGLIAERQED